MKQKDTTKLKPADRLKAYQHARVMIENVTCFGVCNGVYDWMEKNKPHLLPQDIREDFPEFFLQRPADWTPDTCFWWSILDTDVRLEALDAAIQLTKDTFNL